MRKLIALAGVAVLAACSQPDTPAEPAATEEVADAGPVAADGQPTPGMYKVTNADGTVIMVDVREDGTYSTMDADGNVTDTGKWDQKSPELYCETSDGEGEVERCYEEYLDENGVYMSKDPQTGAVSTVERVEA